MAKRERYLYKAVLSAGAIRRVACAIPAYPHLDEDGDKIFENTHFATEEAAWAHLEAEASAWVRDTAKRLETIRQNEVVATRELADRSLLLVKVQAARAERAANG